MFGGEQGSIQLARLFGIRIGATPSWFLILFVMIYTLTGYFDDVIIESGGTAFALAVGATLLFFASIVFHELGHALVARRNGVETAGIELLFFGGVARLTRDPDTPGAEFRVAAAGPAVTLAVLGLCLGGSAIASHAGAVIDGAQFSEDQLLTPAEALLGWLTVINVWVLGINLVPAFPLDGGRIARAIAWRVTGDRGRATRMAALTGRGFGFALMAGGAAMLVTVDAVLGIWAIVLGLFISQAARAELVSSTLTQRIEGITVADIMDREPVWVPAETTALKAQDEFVLRYRYPWFPVVAETTGRYAGVLRSEHVDAALAAGRPATTVAELVEAGSDRLHVAPERALESLLAEPALREIGALAAVDEQGVMVGLVTIEQVRRALLVPAPGT